VDEPELHLGADDKIRAEPFAAVEIPLASLWIADAPAPG
jgi:hypothetical protein